MDKFPMSPLEVSWIGIVKKSALEVELVNLKIGPRGFCVQPEIKIQGERPAVIVRTYQTKR